MAALSKSLVELIRGRSCNELLHPHSCQRAAFNNIWRFTWSNGRYYLPVALLHLLRQTLQGRLSVELLWDALSYYAQLILGGLIDASLISISMCALRRSLGEFRLSTLVFVPAVVGGAFIAFLSPRVKQLQHTAIFQCFIESLLLQAGHPLTKALAASRALQTFVFMCCSALILEGKRRRHQAGFWFLTPVPISTLPGSAPMNDSCEHSEPNCRRHVARGIRNYMLIGFALDSFRALTSCFKSGIWSRKQLRLESTAWLSCYVGIYRGLHCYLRRYGAGSDSLKHLLASFLGGLSYLCYPKLSILSYALLQAWRTLFKSRRQSPKKQPSRFSYADALFPLALAYLIHNYVFQPRAVTALAGMIIDSTTANYAVNINKRLRLLEQAA